MWDVLDKEFLSRKLVAESLETTWKSKKPVKSLGKEYCDLIREFQSALYSVEHLNISAFVTEHDLLWVFIEKMSIEIGNKVFAQLGIVGLFKAHRQICCWRAFHSRGKRVGSY